MFSGGVDGPSVPIGPKRSPTCVLRHQRGLDRQQLEVLKSGYATLDFS